MWPESNQVSASCALALWRKQQQSLIRSTSILGTACQHSSLPAVFSTQQPESFKNQFTSEHGSISKPYRDFSHIQNKSRLLIEAPRNPQVLAPLHFPPLTCHSCPAQSSLATLVFLLFLELTKLVPTFGFSVPGTLDSVLHCTTPLIFVQLWRIHVMWRTKQDFLFLTSLLKTEESQLGNLS